MDDEKNSRGLLARFVELLAGFGLGESLLRVGTTVLSVAMIGVVVWLLQSFYARSVKAGGAVQVLATEPAVAVAEIAHVTQQDSNAFDGIPRVAQPYTTIPTRPRQEIIKYVVQDGDTVFGIAEKFGLTPETILWGNYGVLQDNPHSLKVGQELSILPVDGVYWQWLAENKGGLPAFAKYFGVQAQDILDLPANHLDLATVGDISNPNIPDGTWLIIPGGKRELISWSAPLGVTRENPASARVLGPGACDAVSGGAVGYGTFIWPSNNHYLSGFDFSAIHRGIDIAGNEGEAVYATDAGVIVYAGWNNYGYGNMVMIDHGNGFQSLYAHLSAFNVGCGQSVGQGDVIGAIGTTGSSTGSHLHFEILSSTYKMNPWDVLPK
ncbi:MAG TPA: peptidoglycan DD-metalloendopeptidase family protein [Anaerolineales bacterium]|nr:peptidoglycan DD-metalloendopeptidase family protein [Anaerolineales bacterium]